MATITSAASGNWSVGATWVGGVKPADGDAVVIAAAHNILMDDDLSAYTGLFTVTITGGATPGMLYFKDGTDGYLKIRTGYNLVGTTVTNRGRLLANSDGVWGNTGSLAFANKAIIDFQGTSKLLASNLDIQLYCTQPANLSVRTYGTKQTVTGSATADTLTCVSHGWTDGTPLSVMVTGGSLPAPLQVDTIYYVVNTAANTFKLSDVSGGTAIDLTTDGSGTIEAYSGHTNTATATMNVLDDVTADTAWVTTANHNRVVLVDCYAPEGYDQQRLTLFTINAGTIVLSANVDSAQFPGARIALSSRNVSIRSTGTSGTQSIVDFATSTFTGSVLQCEIVNTAGVLVNNTTFYGHGVYAGINHVISGTIMGCNIGVNTGTNHAISGTIMGCSYGVNAGINLVISGTVTGCFYGVYAGTNLVVSGTIMGCSYSVNAGTNHVISGTITGCNYSVYVGTNHAISGTIMGCNIGIYWSANCIISGTVTGCNYGIYWSTNCIISGTVSKNLYDFRSAGFLSCIVHSGANISATPTIFDRNTDGYQMRIACENFNGVLNVHKVFEMFGDAVKTACDGTGDAPSQDPTGGNGNCIEASNLQSNLSSTNKLLIFDKHRIWMTAAAHTVTYKVQTTFAEISAGNLKLTAKYISGASGSTTEVTNAPAISQRTGTTDWTQTLSVTFTPAAAGWVDFKMELFEYEAGNEVYVWPTPEVS